MSRRHTRPLTRLYFRRNLARVGANETPVPQPLEASTAQALRRRRPQSEKENQRRKEFGRIYGAANSEAGRKVREERDA